MNSWGLRIYLRYQSSPHSPGWLPCFLMVTADAEADLPISLETTARSHEAEAWWAERICWRQDYPPMIDSVAVHGAGRALERKVPLEEV